MLSGRGRQARFACGIALALALAGCGGDEKSSKSGSSSPGAKVFADAGCGNCHTLQAARTNGTAGPNLDEANPDAARVERQVRNGGGRMPSFEDRLSDDQIAAVAEFVAEEAGGDGNVASAAEFKPDDTKLEDCGSDGACLQQAFANLTYEEGPKPALAEFERQMGTSSAVESGCHRIAHMMGAAALARTDGSVGKAFSEGSAVCWSGYYHGILERAFRDVEQEELGETAAKLCSDAEVRAVTFILYQCVHGLGHGLMIYTGYDLPLSLKTCDELGEAWDRQSCTGGVFMENLQSSYGVVSRWLKKNDPIYPCNAVAERHKYYCYLMVTSRILPLVAYDWDRAAPMCRRSEKRWVSLCYQSLGRDASGQTRQNADEILEICAKAGAYESDCVYGAARDITSNDAGGRRAAPFCSKAKPSLRPQCFNGIGTILGGFKADTAGRRAECAAVTPRRYLQDCYAGAAA